MTDLADLSDVLLFFFPTCRQIDILAIGAIWKIIHVTLVLLNNDPPVHLIRVKVELRSYYAIKHL